MKFNKPVRTVTRRWRGITEAQVERVEAKVEWVDNYESLLNDLINISTMAMSSVT